MLNFIFVGAIMACCTYLGYHFGYCVSQKEWWSKFNDLESKVRATSERKDP